MGRFSGLNGGLAERIRRAFSLMRLKVAPSVFYVVQYGRKTIWSLPFGRIELRDAKPWFVSYEGYGEIALPCDSKKFVTYEKVLVK